MIQFALGALIGGAVAAGAMSLIQASRPDAGECLRKCWIMTQERERLNRKLRDRALESMEKADNEQKKKPNTRTAGCAERSRLRICR